MSKGVWLLLLSVLLNSNVLYSQEAEEEEPVKETRDSTHFRLMFEPGVLRVESPYEADIDLYDMLGRRRAHYRATEGESRHYVGNLPTGCYLVVVTGRGRRTSVRVVLGMEH